MYLVVDLGIQKVKVGNRADVVGGVTKHGSLRLGGVCRLEGGQDVAEAGLLGDLIEELQLDGVVALRTRGELEETLSARWKRLRHYGRTYRGVSQLDNGGCACGPKNEHFGVRQARIVVDK